MSDEDDEFQSPEGVVLTVQRCSSKGRAHHASVSVPRRGSADGATNRRERSRSGVTRVSVPRRGSADGATLVRGELYAVGWRFQSPEGVVLTVQLVRGGRAMGARRAFQSPEGVVLTVQLRRSMQRWINLHDVSVPRRGSADGATECSDITRW